MRTRHGIHRRGPLYGIFGVYLHRAYVRDDEWGCLLQMVKVGFGRVLERASAIRGWAKKIGLQAVDNLPAFTVAIPTSCDAKSVEDRCHRLLEECQIERVAGYNEWFWMNPGLEEAMAHYAASIAQSDVVSHHAEILVFDGGDQLTWQEWIQKPGADLLWEMA